MRVALRSARRDSRRRALVLRGVGARHPGQSAEKCAAWLAPLVNRERAPLHLVAVDGPAVLGTATIKLREMAQFPEREHWLGGVFVAPDFRTRGVARALSRHALELGPSLGIAELYLQTDRLDGGLYRTVGFEALERVQNEGHEVLVMRKNLRAPLTEHD
jgi:GNAT superfamily N-acetyltransferase